MQTYPPGTRIGQYEIVSLPMMGGMGVVYFALDHSNDGRPVALKTFRPELLPDRAARDRFLREGTAWIELGSHPHIVRCYKVEYIDPTAFLVLELIAKEQNMPDASLRSWLIPGRPLSLEHALLFALQIARGMQHATEKIPGFVHRDLKPENIFVGADKLSGTNVNRLRVTDFGLVKTIAGGDAPAKTGDEEEFKPNDIQFTRGAGTPLYMAPEQWKGEPVGMFTDFYALGCILYEMVIGKPVAEGKTIDELQEIHCKGKILPLSTSLPKDLESLLVKCMKIDTSQRYQNWEEVILAIELICSAETHASILQVAKSTEMIDEELSKTGWSYNAIGTAYIHLGQKKAGIDYFEKALQSFIDDGDLYGQCALLANLGVAYMELGDEKRAIEYYERALRFSNEVRSLEYEGKIYHNLGSAYRRLGDLQRAITAYEQALTIAQKVGDSNGESETLTNLANVYLYLGNAQQAISYSKKCLALHRESGNRRGETAALNSLSGSLSHLGDFQQSIGYSKQSLTISREIGDRNGEGAALSNLSKAYFSIGEVKRAVMFNEQALIIAREVGDRVGEGVTLNNLGTYYLQLEDGRLAGSYFKEALIIAREVGDKEGEANALNNLGEVYRKLGDHQRAIDYYEEALKINRDIGDRVGEGNNLGNLGIIYKNLGDMKKAINHYEEQLIISREIGYRQGEANALGNLGNSYLILGDKSTAFKYFQDTMEISRKIGDFNVLAMACFNTSSLYFQQDSYVGALPLAREAARIWAQIGSPNVQVAQQLIAQIQGGIAPNQGNSIQIAFEDFQRAVSHQDMQNVVIQRPFMKDNQFIQAIEEILNEKVPPEHKPAFEERLGWLRQIANQK
jgi:tetratricopeptide (TPR) repeat protein